MRKTSFGYMDEISNGTDKFEYLEFYKSGRPHKHDKVESFKVLSGCGFLNIEGVEALLVEGDVQFIPFGKLHYMRPAEDSVLRIMVCYTSNKTRCEEIALHKKVLLERLN